MRHCFFVILCLVCCLDVCAQLLSLSDVEKLYRLQSCDRVNSFFNSKNWENNASVVEENHFEISWQHAGYEDVVVRQDSFGNKVLTYRLHDASQAQKFVDDKKSFKSYSLLGVSDKNESLYRKNNALVTLYNNKTRGILTVKYEVRTEQQFWSDLYDKISTAHSYSVGTYLPEEGGVVFGFSPDGEFAYVVAMRDCKNGNGSLWSSSQKTIPSCFLNKDWHVAYNDMDGSGNTSAVCKHLESNVEVQIRSAQLAAACTDADKNDWCLPSIGQLRILSENLADVNETLRSNGGVPIAKTWYWSSSQYDQRMVWAYNFKTMIVGQSAKDGYDRTRPVRSVRIKK